MAKKKLKGEIQYYPPELMPYMLCTACLGVVIDQNEQAREIFQGIVECGYLPGYQMIQEEADGIIPDSKTLLKEIVEKSGYDYQKPPRSVVDGISYARGMIKGSKEIVSKYTDRVMPEVQKKILKEIPEKVDLILASRDYIESFSNIHINARKIISNSIENARKITQTAIDDYKLVYKKDFVGLTAYMVDDNTKKEEIPVLLNWDDIRQELEKRNTQLVNLKKRYPTGQIISK